MSSYGHIRDLQKHGFSIDVEDDFTPVYEIPDDKKELVKRLKKAASEADVVWLASDEDREGRLLPGISRKCSNLTRLQHAESCFTKSRNPLY